MELDDRCLLRRGLSRLPWFHVTATRSVLGLISSFLEEVAVPQLVTPLLWGLGQETASSAVTLVHWLSRAKGRRVQEQ